MKGRSKQRKEKKNGSYIRNTNIMAPEYLIDILFLPTCFPTEETGIQNDRIHKEKRVWQGNGRVVAQVFEMAAEEVDGDLPIQKVTTAESSTHDSIRRPAPSSPRYHRRGEL
ncbi:hypothetical protein CISG_09487 [Coccidioides immitis RMSCC 3703]|uniref:Uncharacterized protein n=1 Tax=Coccidioides immitis RMSCC 3703 TaxID=454286 RepID=A0A0J8RAY0_COCIT|nr:hypothetical protein CISG_09487 [Coccidioides immitis RMSCC 3703]